MIEMDSPPKLTHLLVLASCPDELLRLGAMVGAFAAGGTAVRAVLLSDGLPRDATAELRLERNHRLTRAANGVGVAELIMLDHPVTDVPRTDVHAMAREVLGAMERTDAVLVADPEDRRERTARGRLAVYRTALRVAGVIGAPVYVCVFVRPVRQSGGEVLEVEVSRNEQRSAISFYQGIPELPGRHRPDESEIEHLVSRQPQSLTLGLANG